MINNNIEDDTSFNILKDNLIKDRCSSSIVLPIFFKEKVIGALNVYSTEKNIFRNSELFLLGNISKIVSLSIDALEKESKQHESEEALKLSEERHRTIFEEAPLGIALVDSSYGIFLRSNPTFSNSIGRSQDELKKISWMSIIHPDDFSKVQGFVHDLSLKKISSFKLVIRFFHKDNHIIWLNISVVAFANGGGDILKFLIMAEDVSENMLNQLNLKKSQEMFTAVTDLSPDLIILVDKDGSIIFNSAASFYMHGYKKIDLNGNNLLDFIFCDDKQSFSKEFSEISNNPNKILNLQYRFLNKDGSSSWIEAAGINQLQNPLINGIIIISRDIGKRKKMEEDLRRALEAREEFLSIASHELKTPITSLKLQLQILNRKIKPEENILSDQNALSSLISNSIKQVDRITDLVDNLLDVSRIQTGKLLFNFEKINLSKSILSLLDCFRELFLQAGIVLDVRIEPDLECFVDKNRIEQVFINLFSNAIKYAPGKPVLISFKKIDGIAEFMIQDQGPGIASDKQSLIFNRFERANSSAKVSGLGLGLYISKYIVDTHKGKISVESSLGVGSIFKVDLPLYSS
jgi:two-component system CheB/CheR fusion protein